MIDSKMGFFACWSYAVPSTFFQIHKEILALREKCPNTECPKNGVFSGPYFPVFGLNTEIYGVEDYRNIRTRKKLRIWTLFTQCWVFQYCSIWTSQFSPVHEKDLKLGFLNMNLGCTPKFFPFHWREGKSGFLRSPWFQVLL